MNLFWCKNKRGYGNFGDELNPYIVCGLTGIQPDFVDVMKLPKNKINFFKAVLKNVLKGRFSAVFQKEYRVSLSNQKVVLAIGSVVGWYHTSNIIVWGSGILSKTTKVHNADFRAVRGKRTLKRLKDLGYNINSTVLGDPALLLPLVNQKMNPKKKYKLGMIPHYIHYEVIKENVKDNDILIINLLDSIDNIIEEIMMCEFTISSSLHGIIVSHAYEIPSVWVSFENLDLPNLLGDDIKFADYFSSLAIPEYKPITTSIPFDMLELEAFRLEHVNKSLPDKNNVYKVQKDLLKNAPFKIKNNFFKLIN